MARRTSPPIPVEELIGFPTAFTLEAIGRLVSLA